MRYDTYNEGDYPFRFIVKDILRADLETLHKTMNYEVPKNVGEDQKSPAHKKFYDYINAHPGGLFDRIYMQFVKDKIYPLYDESILVQFRPTMRFHFVGNLAVALYHRDRDFFHATKERNYCVPLTPMYGNNSIWIESNEGLENYSPMGMLPGAYVEFDGANLRHGNKINDTNITRVSFDFRVIRYKDYDESFYLKNNSVAANRKMVIGEYWTVIN